MAGGRFDRFGVALSLPACRANDSSAPLPYVESIGSFTFQTRLPEIDFGNLSEFGAAVLYVLCQSTGDLALASDVDDVRP
jgi:hypothetical protein